MTRARGPLRHPAVRRLLGAQVVALAGTGLLTVALGLLAFDLAGAGAGRVLGTVLAIKMVAYVLVAPVAQAVVGRLPRRTVILAADVVRAAVALALPFAGEVWQVYALVFVLQSAAAVRTPTFQAVLPDLLTDEAEYTQALSLTRLVQDLEMVLSPMLAAALLLVVPQDALFWGTALGFTGSALLVGSLTGLRRVGAVPGGAAEAVPFAVRVRRGARLMWRVRALRPVLALNLVVAAAGAFVLVQTVVIVRDTFGQGNTAVALMLAVNGAGSMAAVFALPRVLARLSERVVMLGAGALLVAATAAVPLALRTPTVAAGLTAVGVLWFAVGLGWAAAEVPFGRIVVREIDDDDRPAVFAAEFSASHACWLLTYPLAGWLGAVGLGSTAALLAGVAAAAWVVALRWWRQPAGPGSTTTGDRAGPHATRAA